MAPRMPSIRASACSFAILLSASLPVVASASEVDAQPAHHHDAQQAAEEHENDEIVVSGHPPIDFGLMAATAAIEGDTLLAEARGQIGEVLSGLPGVSASSFAPGVSRPVLRGFDGDRISVLTDGIGSIDASSVSADHAVVFDTLTVDHIDVLHGPAVLLFGGQAIGGAVNALDKRIPRRVPDNISGAAIAGYATAARERALGGAVDAPLGDRFVVHVDANWRKSDDVRTGGLLASPALRAQLADMGEEELAGQSGRVPNSAARATTLGAGVAFIDAGGNLGVSVQRFDTRYGVPARPGLGEADVAIDLGQTRVDLRGALELSGLFDNLQLRGAFGDYAHVELEGGEVGTRFAGKGVEFRADLIQAKRTGWRGRSGVHMVSRKMTVRGEEAVVPDNQVERIGLFTLQSVEVAGGLEVEAAGRFEHASVKARQAGLSRSFKLWSGAAGLSYEPVRGWKTGINFVRGARAPSPEELLSDGLHVATQAYELGDRSFGIEKSNGWEAYLRHNGDRFELSLTAYLTRFSGFIAALPTGDEVEGFPVMRYAQLPAHYKGFEASASFVALDWGDGRLRFDAAADYTHARLKGIGPVPRIPPLRVRGGVQVSLPALELRGEVEWNARQDRVAGFENPVPGFSEVNLSADWHPFGEEGPLTLVLAANNLFDTVGRRAASFTRDFVPLPGRDVRLTAKLSF